MDPEKSRRILPDVAVVRPPGRGRSAASGQQPDGGAATLESVTLPFPSTEEVRERWIQILHRPERSLVAVLELLSPTNKTNPGRGQFLAQRARLFNQEVHHVELDLLLRGARLPMGRPLPPGDFYAIVARSEQRPEADVYAWTIRDRLPVIPIPLLKPDRDIFVDLAAVFATTCERGRYAKSLDYAAEIELPLSESNKRWANERAAGKN